MNLLEDIEDTIGNIKDQREKNLVAYINNNLRISNPEVRRQAEAYIKDTLENKIGKNIPISSFDAIMLHGFVTKISLYDLGLYKTRINYRAKRPEDNQAGGIHSPKTNTITFFTENVCNKREFLDKYSNDVERGSKSRLEMFARQMFVAQHEIQHIIQFEDFDKAVKDVNNLNKLTYIMSLQNVARTFSKSRNSKYYKENLFLDRLYNDNHDQFLQELDADAMGIERTLLYLKKYSRKTYEVAIGKNHKDYLTVKAKKEKLIEDYANITWKHDTNPNNVPVSAMFKTNTIIDTILPTLSRWERKDFFNIYPALTITHNNDGTKKSLDKIEKERKAKIDEILKNGLDSEIQRKVTQISRLYETAIEADAVLSFENCLRHIAKLSWDSDRYFTKNGYEIKYDPKEVRKEIDASKEKALALLAVMESADSKDIRNLYDQYQREGFRNFRLNPQGLRFLEDKKKAFFEIHYAIYQNAEFQKGVIEEREMNEKKVDLEKKSIDAIKKVFPELTPRPHKDLVPIDNKLTLLENYQEKLLLLQGVEDYIKTVTTGYYSHKENFVSPNELRQAIETIYPFDIPAEEAEKFKNSNLPRLNNIYSPYQTKEKEENSTETELETTENE